MCVWEREREREREREKEEKDNKETARKIMRVLRKR